ncbi:acetate uptake transporter [Acidocella sp.]|uniref:acetate uptake transporter n=1 Tax=Acidocella sp. TaxID=50710 RepID=UPI00262E3345|nr:acetate uptake transporter [Acidocella sp.]
MKLANPAPVGLFGFALTTLLLSLVNAGLLPAGAMFPVILPMAFAYGGTAQLLAGLFELVKGNTFGMVAFVSYGAFWWTFALLVKFFIGGIPAGDAGLAIGWYLIAWGLMTTVMWIGSFAANKALILVFTLLTPTFFLLGFGNLLGMAGVVTLGGYLGLATAAAAFYLGAADVINEAHGKTILPVG